MRDGQLPWLLRHTTPSCSEIVIRLAGPPIVTPSFSTSSQPWRPVRLDVEAEHRLRPNEVERLSQQQNGTIAHIHWQ